MMTGTTAKGVAKVGARHRIAFAAPMLRAELDVWLKITHGYPVEFAAVIFCEPEPVALTSNAHGGPAADFLLDGIVNHWPIGRPAVFKSNTPADTLYTHMDVYTANFGARVHDIAQQHVPVLLVCDASPHGKAVGFHALPDDFLYMPVVHRICQQWAGDEQGATP